MMIHWPSYLYIYPSWTDILAYYTDRITDVTRRLRNGKAGRRIAPTVIVTDRQPLALVHSDLMGPFEVESAGGNKYILTAIDDFSGKAAAKPLKHKSQVSAELKGDSARLGS
jgi:hypothetical protein